MDALRPRLPQLTQIDIENRADRLLWTLKRDLGIEFPDAFRQEQITELQGRELRSLDGRQKVRGSRGFATLCGLGFDGEVILQHVDKLIGLDDATPTWDDAVNLNRDKVKTFCIEAYEFGSTVNHLFFPAAEDMIDPEIRAEIDRIPDLIQILIGTLATLREQLDGRRQKGPAGTHKSHAIDFLNYVSSICKNPLPYDALADIFTLACGEDVSGDALRKFVERNRSEIN